MAGGLALVRAHLDSFMARRVSDFDGQVAPTFRYQFLPPILGEGPPQARRWCDICFSVYREWNYETQDAREDADVVMLPISFVGLDPVEPENTSEYFYDSCVFEVGVKDGLLTACTALHLPFDAHEKVSTRRSA